MMERSDNERKLFKDWFDRDAARALAKQVAAAYSKFDQTAFVRRATNGLQDMEFHARVKHFSDALAAGLPPVPRALDILVESLPQPLPDCDSVTDGWMQWPVGHFIGEHGLDHYKGSMEAMKHLTMRFSAEFPIRAFIERYPEKTMRDLLKLTAHPNPHVRRWCSEGCRPRLPWGRKLRDLVADPSAIWPILEALKDDPELYVRRSVANNINDIAKDHPELVVQRCRQWLKKSERPTPERKWVVKHGLRTLLKQGHAGALSLLGYEFPQKIEVKFTLKPAEIRIGEAVELQVSLLNTGKIAQSLMLDYVVHYVRQGGKVSKKVFKWKTLVLESGESVSLVKRHAMKVTTVRKLYAGKHGVKIQINGQGCGEKSFRLKT
jgi:3-methyladenine DNA glycosylase AlkC